MIAREELVEALAVSAAETTAVTGAEAEQETEPAPVAILERLGHNDTLHGRARLRAADAPEATSPSPVPEQDTRRNAIVDDPALASCTFEGYASQADGEDGVGKVGDDFAAQGYPGQRLEHGS